MYIQLSKRPANFFPGFCSFFKKASLVHSASCVVKRLTCSTWREMCVLQVDPLCLKGGQNHSCLHATVMHWYKQQEQEAFRLSEYIVTHTKHNFGLLQSIKVFPSTPSRLTDDVDVLRAGEWKYSFGCHDVAPRFFVARFGFPDQSSPGLLSPLQSAVVFCLVT